MELMTKDKVQEMFNFKELSFTDHAMVNKKIDSTKIPLVVGYGVDWFIPARKTLEALAEVSQAGVEIYLVDQEQSPTVCRENNVQLGTPFVKVYHQCKAMPFKFNAYSDVSQSHVLNESKKGDDRLMIGALTRRHATTLVSAVVKAVSRHEKSIEIIW
jgi:hypothetical protein